MQPPAGGRGGRGGPPDGRGPYPPPTTQPGHAAAPADPARPPQGQQGQQPAYPPQGQQPAYPPQGQPAYPPQGQPAYPPQGQPAYPPQPQPGYPPQPQPGYPQAQPGYPQAQPGYPQPAAHAGAFPSPFANPSPSPSPNPNPNPYPNPNPNPYPNPNPNPNPYPNAGPNPNPNPAPYPAAADHGFASFLRISLRRAFHLRIEPHEVTATERAQLERAGVTEPTFQAFLSWRRSMLFAFATMIIPLMALKAYELYSEANADPATAKLQETWRGLQTLPLVAEAAFCLLAWSQLGRWTSWRKQRRVLLWGWIGFFVAPFIVYLYPLRTLLPDLVAGGSDDPMVARANEGARLMIGMVASVEAMIHLAPKAVSLVAGMVRGSIVTKLLFPGASAPGWLIVIGAVIYALFIYVVLIVPFQITGSTYFIGAVVAIVVGEAMLARGGYRLARPMTREQAIAGVKRARGAYFAAIVAGAVFIVLAMADLVEVLHFRWITVVNLIGTFLTNVWILTLITTDLLIDGLDRARLQAADDKLGTEVDQQLGAFVGVRTVAPGLQANPFHQPPGPPR